MIKYKIVEIHPSENMIVVRYYTDTITEESLVSQRGDDGAILRCRTDYAYNLPLPIPTGADLDAFIMARAPVEWLKTKEKVLGAQENHMEALQGLLNVESVGVEQSITDSATTDNGMREAETMAIVQKALALMANSTV